MSVPTITKISLVNGPTGGRRIVKIWGGGFQLSPGPTTSGVTPARKPSVEVLFGTVPAREVRVLADSYLHVVTPIHDPGTVSITIRNIDQDGVLVPGEIVTKAAAYTFERPTIGTGEPGKQSNLARLVRTLVEELRRQILPNVVLTTHTDYDDTPDGANIAALADIPGLVLAGPTLRLNRFYNSNQARTAVDGIGDTYEQRPSRTVDVIFTLIGVDELMARELDLVHECTAFFLRNTVLRMLRNPAIAGDYVEYELEIDEGGDFKSAGTANNSNIRAFSGSFLVRGLDIDDADMSTVLTSPISDVLPGSPGHEVGGVADPTADVIGVPSSVYLDGSTAADATSPAGHIAQLPPKD